MLCQVTSNAYSDPLAVELPPSAFSAGSLQRTSFARPGKLFTASDTLVVRQVGTLTGDTLTRLVGQVVDLLRAALPE